MPNHSPLSLIAAIRRLAGAKAILIHPRCQSDIDDLGYDIEDVASVLANCVDHEIHKHEPDDGGRPWYAVVLKVHLDGEPLPFYVKVVLKEPDLGRATLLSFKIWN